MECCRLTSRRSQPPLALLFPDQSGFTPRVGGGSAFYVRHHCAPQNLCHSNYTSSFRTRRFRAVMLGSKRLGRQAFLRSLSRRLTFGETPDSDQRATKTKPRDMSFTWSRQRESLRLTRTSPSRLAAVICARHFAGAATLLSVPQLFRQPQHLRSLQMVFIFIQTMTSFAPPMMLLRRRARSWPRYDRDV